MRPSSQLPSESPNSRTSTSFRSESEHTVTETRSLREIAKDIYNTWQPVNYAARPYVDAMLYLDTMSSTFGHDDAKGIVLRFLSNASTWRGADARRIKAELKSIMKGA